MVKSALIVGAGTGISLAFARVLTTNGYEVTLAGRNPGAALTEQARAIGARIARADATDAADVERLFAGMDSRDATPDVVLYNASYRVRGPIVELEPAAVGRSLAVTAFGGFLVAQQAARRMLARERGTILFTGASASVKGYPGSAPFAMGKFALRGLAQSMARELGPQGIHVAHVVIDGGVRSASRPEPADRPDSMLDPAAIAAAYWSLVQQPRSAWSSELELRPWVEKF